MKSKDFKQAFRRYIDQTTLHGLSYIYQSSSLLVKLIWTVVFCSFLAFGCWLLYRSFNTFFSYETNTSVSRVRVNEITFPSVTICNLYYTTDINQKNYSADKINAINIFTSPPFMKAQILANPDITFNAFMNTGGRYYKSLLDQDKIGFAWSEMLMGCFFMNDNCSTKAAYKEVISSKYGRCHTSPGSGQTCN